LYTPTAGLGELWNAGLAATAIVSAVFGAILAWLEIRAKRLLADGKQILGLILIVLGALFLPFFVQYNLRAAARMLYYALAIDIVARMFNLRSGVATANGSVTPDKRRGSSGLQYDSA